MHCVRACVARARVRTRGSAIFFLFGMRVPAHLSHARSLAIKYCMRDAGVCVGWFGAGTRVTVLSDEANSL